ncbi:MAG: VOC family protein [Jannaschia sp.]
MLGFDVKFGRPEDGFYYVEMGHAQLMPEAVPDDPKRAWITDDLEVPFGRGMNLQIEVAAVHPIYERVLVEDIVPYRPLRTAWYPKGDHENEQDEFLVQDPDGYLLRFMQHVGTRPIGDR